MKKLKIIVVIFIIIAFSIRSFSKAPSKYEVLKVMKKASSYMMNKVSNRGGFVYVYKADLSEQWGEVPARKSQFWIQPPGTPVEGALMLRAYRITKDPVFLNYAKRIANALIYAQHPEGGWHYFGDFDPEGIPDYYKNIASKSWGFEEYYHYYGNCTFDDEVYSSTTDFLMELYLETLDPMYKVPLIKALDFALKSQFKNGAWPQRYPLHDDYTSYYTFNDNVIVGNIYLLYKAYRKLGTEKYKEAALRGMYFVIDSQMPYPQAGWAQQYTHDMKPGQARNFEPAAICSTETKSNIIALLSFYKITGDRRFLEPIPKAIEWLRRSVINKDPNKLYNGAKYNLATYYEVGTNKPLYAHRKKARNEKTDIHQGYWIDHKFGNFPGHYGMVTYIDIDALEREYKRVSSLSPEEAKKEYLNQNKEKSKKIDVNVIKKIIKGLNKEGAWLEKIFVIYYPDFKQRDKGKTFIGINIRTFLKNMNTLLDYYRMK